MMLRAELFYFIISAIIVDVISASEPGTEVASSEVSQLIASTQNLISNQDVFTINDAVEFSSSPGSDENSAKGVKRTVNFRGRSSKFNQPIIVSEDRLFTPADEIPRKQINVQIIAPEPHNNGQYLKETVYSKEENSTSVSSTTTTTTEGPFRGSSPKISNKFLAPIQAGLRLSNDDKPKSDEDCDEASERPMLLNRGRKVQQKTTVEQKNIKTKTVTLEYGTKAPTKSPCGSDCPPPPCGSKCQPTPRPRPPPPPRPVSPPPARIIQQPVYIHTQVPVEKIVDRPVPYPVTQVVQKLVPYPVEKVVDRPVEIEKLVVKEVKVPFEKIVERPIEIERVVEKKIPFPVDRIVEKFIDRPFEVEKIVEKPYAVQVDRIVEKIVDRPVEVPKYIEKQVQVPVDRIVEKIVDRPVAVEHRVPYPVPYPVEKIVDRPVEVERIVEKEVQVPVDRFVERIVDRPVAVPVEKIVDRPVPYPVEKVVEKIVDRPVPVEVGVPVHIPYYIQVEVPIQVPTPYLVEKNIHIPVYLTKPHPKFFIITKTKPSKHNLFDLKHSANEKVIKHVYLNQPYGIPNDIVKHHHQLDTIGLLPPPISFKTSIPTQTTKHVNLQGREPRYQSYNDHYPNYHTAASVNHIKTALPLYNSFHNHHYKDYYAPAGPQSFGLNHKDIRWEYGFKPPLIPSVEIDSFGNPIDKSQL